MQATGQRLNEQGNIPIPRQHEKGKRLKEPGNMHKPGQHKEGKKRISRLNVQGNMHKQGQFIEGKRRISRFNEPGNILKPDECKPDHWHLPKLNQRGSDCYLPLPYRPYQPSSYWQTGTCMYVPKHQAGVSKDWDNNHFVHTGTEKKNRKK